MAGLDHELESVIVDLSTAPWEELSALDDAAVIAAISPCRGGMSARLWSADDMSTRLWSADSVRGPTAPNE